ncbi:MAG: NAD-dependent epimerase/dehydratase family protein, partial [Ignavibacteria bacterium]
MSNKQRALVIGGTGLVGSHLLEQLDADKHFEKIYTLSRRPCTAHSRIVNIITELDVPSGNEDFFDVDVVFCAIGSTIKKAGSQAEFRRIDYELPMHIARLAKQRG